MTLLFVLGMSGCAKINNTQYCDVASPLYYSQETLAWLSKNDIQTLRDIVAANTKWKELCR